MQAVRVTQGRLNNPGEFLFSEDYTHIYIWIPGCKSPDCLRIKPGNPSGERCWGWDGDIDAPTLTPSIHAIGEWHGYLRKGRFESC